MRVFYGSPLGKFQRHSKISSLEEHTPGERERDHEHAIGEEPVGGREG